jgi:uncharacterized membrane protein
VGSTFSPLEIPGALSSYASGINSQGQIIGSYKSAPDLHRGFIYDRGVITPVDSFFSEEEAPASLGTEPFDFGDGTSGTITWIRSESFTFLNAINDRGDILGGSQVWYAAQVDCNGCGLTSDDFGNQLFLATFAGERDGSRTVHVKNSGKQAAQKIRVPAGVAVRNLQSH